MQGLWWMLSQDTPSPPLPSPSPLDTQLSNDLCLFTGWDVQAGPGQGSSWQPQVPVFWSHGSSRVWGRAATRLCRKGGGWKRHQLLWWLPTPGLSYFFFWTTGISDGWKWKCRSSALTCVCTIWVNTSLDTICWVKLLAAVCHGFLHEAFSALYHQVTPAEEVRGIWVPKGPFNRGDILPNRKTGKLAVEKTRSHALELILAI